MDWEPSGAMDFCKGACLSKACIGYFQRCTKCILPSTGSRSFFFTPHKKSLSSPSYFEPRIRLVKDLFNSVGKLIAGARSLALISHSNPDGDTFGSVTALYAIIRANFSDKKVQLINADAISPKLQFLPGAMRCTRRFDLAEYDLAITCDMPDPKLSGFLETHRTFFTKPPFPTINIDHHVTNVNYGTVNVIDVEQASTTLVVLNLCQHLGWKIPTEAATAILAGVYTDTGSFLHPNTTPQTFFAASQLMDLGAQPEHIVRSIFADNSVDYLRTVGKVLRRAKVTPSGVAFTCIFKDDVPDDFPHYDSLKSLVVGMINTITGIRYSCVLIEKEGSIRGSLRTLRDDIDTTELAAKFGGGGHRKASGFTIQGVFIRHGETVRIRTTEGQSFSLV